MKDLYHLIIILIAALTISFTSCTARAGAVYLQKNEAAPFAGMLLNDNSELKARTAIQQNDTYRNIIENQYAMINNLHQENKLKESKLFILENNQESTTMRIIYFVGGAIVGGLVVDKIKH